MDTSKYLAFNGRDEYLAARAKWRAAYRELSADIRRIRREMVNTFRAGQDASLLQGDQLVGRYHAACMMVVRAEMKVRAAEQWKAEHVVAA